MYNGLEIARPVVPHLQVVKRRRNVEAFSDSVVLAESLIDLAPVAHGLLVRFSFVVPLYVG